MFLTRGQQCVLWRDKLTTEITTYNDFEYFTDLGIFFLDKHDQASSHSALNLWMVPRNHYHKNAPVILLWPWGILIKYWADSRFVPSQWETALLCNDVSHWLGVSLESAPIYMHIKQSRLSICVCPLLVQICWQLESVTKQSYFE